MFLGLRIQCARCHHHPFEKWSQDDYYGLAAFFSRVGNKNLIGGNQQMRDRRVFHTNARPGSGPQRTAAAKCSRRPAWATSRWTVTAERRSAACILADWMADPKNPFFAKAVVNRYWKHFFSRGIVEPEDDMRETNPPSNPELLDAPGAELH